MIKILKILLALALIGALFLFTDVRELYAALQNLTLTLVIQLLSISALLILVSVIKWRMIIKALGGDFSVSFLFKKYLIGYFVNSFLPSQVGGDVVRSMSVGKTLGNDKAFAATILERYTGIFAMSFLALISMWFVAVPQAVRLAIILFAIAVVGAFVVAASPKILSILQHLRIPTEFINKLQAGFKIVYKERIVVVKALALSFLYHTLTVINTAVCAYAVGWKDYSLLDLFTVLPLILLVGALPLTPSSLGIQEGAFYYFLHMIGATKPEALGIALILRAKTYILAAVGGIFFYRK